MNFLKKISPEWALRIGFAAMYLYSGTDIWKKPDSWTWAIPDWFNELVSHFMPIETYLRLQATGEIIFALVFLAWFLNRRIVRYVALLAAIEMAGILTAGNTGIDETTFRDMGLLGGLMALYVILGSKGMDKIKPNSA